jgi:hypothetical protein
VVRRADAATVKRDLATLAKYPALDTLHPGLKAKLQRLTRTPNAKALYGLPYSVAYADEMIRSHVLLNEAADAVERDDPEFARYLRNRGRDLLTDDYEAGDAAWLKGNFKNLNARSAPTKPMTTSFPAPAPFTASACLPSAPRRARRSAKPCRACRSLRIRSRSTATRRCRRISRSASTT